MGPLHFLTFGHGKKIIPFCHFYFASHSASMIFFRSVSKPTIAGGFRFVLVFLVILFG